jgi:hypothetical protein
MDWRIYYSDGSTFDSTQGTPEEAPSRGFICVVGYYLSGIRDGQRYVLKGWDHYFYDRDAKQWWGCDRDGLIDLLCENRVWAYKLGRTVTVDEWEAIMETARSDPDFPKRREGGE